MATRDRTVPPTERELKERILTRITEASGLHVRPLGGGHYYVTGGKEPHNVSIREDEPACDCAHFEWSSCICKHQIAVRLHELRRWVLHVETESERRRADFHRRLAEAA